MTFCDQKSAHTVVLFFVFMLSWNASRAQTETVGYRFQGYTTDGSGPYGALISDGAGGFYGNTYFGGNGGCAGSGNYEYGCGTVFEVVPTKSGEWIESELYTLKAGTEDGAWAEGALARDQRGNLYGTTWAGGAHGDGTVYEVMPPQVPGGPWTESVLYSFGANAGDGRNSAGRLAIDSLGNLYGTTVYGGANNSKRCSSDGCGTIFELSPTGNGAWVETILHNFGGLDGLDPYAGVVLDNSGDLFGTTAFSGTYYCANCGIAYLLKHPVSAGDPWQEIVMHRFVGGADGSIPFSDLTVVGDIVYGTTSAGGANNDGVVFQIKRVGSGWGENVIHSFAGNPDGSKPTGAIIKVGGDLYGTTEFGGTANQGTVFRLSPDGATWNESILYNLLNTPDGSAPFSGVTYFNGSLYGVTTAGGSSGNYGTVFEIAP